MYSSSCDNCEIIDKYLWSKGDFVVSIFASVLSLRGTIFVSRSYNVVTVPPWKADALLFVPFIHLSVLLRVHNGVRGAFFGKNYFFH